MTVGTAQELYVYYTLEPSRVTAVLGAFQQLRMELQQRLPGLQSRLLKRPPVPGSQSALQTWMEIHTWPQGSPGAPADWPARVEQLAQPLATLLAGPRHQELFEPMA